MVTGEEYTIEKLERLKKEQTIIDKEVNKAMDDFSFEVKNTFISGFFALVCATMAGYLAIKLFQGDIDSEVKNSAKTLIVMMGFFSLLSTYVAVLGVKDIKKSHFELRSKLVEKVKLDKFINERVKSIKVEINDGMNKEK